MVQSVFTPDQFVKNYWTYYRDIEKQVLQLRQFVSFSQNNYSTFSIELLKLLQLTCSEIDVFAKQIATNERLGTTIDDYRSIMSWGPAVYNALPNIDSETLTITNSDCIIQPWKNWRYEKNSNPKKGRRQYKYQDKCNSPSWWNDYNKVKHQRAFVDDSGTHYYEKANLRNLLCSLGALYILEKRYYTHIGGKDPLSSELFTEFKGSSFNNS